MFLWHQIPFVVKMKVRYDLHHCCWLLEFQSSLRLDLLLPVKNCLFQFHGKTKWYIIFYDDHCNFVPEVNPPPDWDVVEDTEESSSSSSEDGSISLSSPSSSSSASLSFSDASPLPTLGWIRLTVKPNYEFSVLGISSSIKKVHYVKWFKRKLKKFFLRFP